MPKDTIQMERVAAQAVAAMVGQHIRVTVEAVQTRGAAPAGRPGAGSHGDAMVSVVLAGPDTAPHRADKLASAQAVATSWGIDQLVVAARRAAEAILASNPSWRRGEPGSTQTDRAGRPSR